MLLSEFSEAMAMQRLLSLLLALLTPAPACAAPTLDVALDLGSPFDPHPISPSPRSPFFEGWFARVVDHQRGRSASFIVGVFEPAHGSNFTQLWAALLLHGVGESNGTTATHQFLDNAHGLEIKRKGRPIDRPSARTAPVDFVLTVSGCPPPNPTLLYRPYSRLPHLQS